MPNEIQRALQDFGVDTSEFQSLGEVAGLIGTVPGPSALKLWHRLRALHPTTGVWPILRGDPSQDFAELAMQAPPPGPIPEQSARELLYPRLVSFCDIWSNPEEGLTRVPSLRPELGFEAVARLADDSRLMGFGGKKYPLTEWPDSPKCTGEHFLALAHILTKRPYSEVWLQLVPEVQPFQAIPSLPFGGWNECPDPEVIAAVLHDWGIRFGAVPVCVTGDTLECLVDRPPQTQEEAFSLACEQWLFCDDIVSQGTQSVHDLAIEIWKAPTWFFWWD